MPVTRGLASARDFEALNRRVLQERERELRQKLSVKYPEIQEFTELTEVEGRPALMAGKDKDIPVVLTEDKANVTYLETLQNKLEAEKKPVTFRVEWRIKLNKYPGHECPGIQ